MSYVTKLLATNERVVRVARVHWITLLPTMLIDLALGIVIVGLVVVAVLISQGVLPLLGLVLFVVPVGHFLYRLWLWWSVQYVVTNRRIIQVTGLANKRVSDTLLEKINDIVTEQSALGRLLKYGNVEIISGSESGSDVFRRLADPNGFKKALLDQKALPTSPATPATGAPAAGTPEAADIPELIAELDDLRKRGVLTDEEFAQKKRRLLDRI